MVFEESGADEEINVARDMMSVTYLFSNHHLSLPRVSFLYFELLPMSVEPEYIQRGATYLMLDEEPTLGRDFVTMWNL